jgi:hypothetical protein
MFRKLVKKENFIMIDSNSIGCPNPEWLGIWIDRDGLRVKVTWESWGSFIGWHREWPYGHSCSGETWYGPFESRWKMIEPAPFESRSHTKHISTVAVGWDPYGLG